MARRVSSTRALFLPISGAAIVWLTCNYRCWMTSIVRLDFRGPIKTVVMEEDPVYPRRGRVPHGSRTGTIFRLSSPHYLDLFVSASRALGTFKQIRSRKWRVAEGSRPATGEPSSSRNEIFGPLRPAALSTRRIMRPLTAFHPLSPLLFSTSMRAHLFVLLCDYISLWRSFSSFHMLATIKIQGKADSMEILSISWELLCTYIDFVEASRVVVYSIASSYVYWKFIVFLKM